MYVHGGYRMTGHRKLCLPLQLVRCAWLRSQRRACRPSPHAPLTITLPNGHHVSPSPLAPSSALRPSACYTHMTRCALSCQRMYASTTNTSNTHETNTHSNLATCNDTKSLSLDLVLSSPTTATSASSSSRQRIAQARVELSTTLAEAGTTGRRRRSTRTSALAEDRRRVCRADRVWVPEERRAPERPRTIVPPTPMQSAGQTADGHADTAVRVSGTRSVPRRTASVRRVSRTRRHDRTADANTVDTVADASLVSGKESVLDKEGHDTSPGDVHAAHTVTLTGAKDGSALCSQDDTDESTADAHAPDEANLLSHTTNTSLQTHSRALHHRRTDATRTPTTKSHATKSEAYSDERSRSAHRVVAAEEEKEQHELHNNADEDSANEDDEEEEKKQQRFFAAMMSTTAVSHTDLRRPPLVEESTLVYNTLTGRMMSENNPIIQYLLTVGFGINRERQLYVASTEKLNDLANRVRAGAVSLPPKWPAALNATLGAVLRNRAMDNPADVIAQVVQVKIHSVVRSRYASVVTSADVNLPSFASSNPSPWSAEVAEAMRSTRAVNNSHNNTSSSSSSSSALLLGDNNDKNQKSDTNDNNSAERAWQRSSSADLSESHACGIELNDEQERVIGMALRGHHLYIGGSAGTGKTVLLRVLSRRLQAHRLRVAMTATTGVAGCHVGGATFHHTFGVSARGDFLRRGSLLEYDVIIIDEVSMFPQRLFEEFDTALREEAGTPDLPFGGVQLILCGDFLQLGCINEPSILSSSLFHALFVKIRLEVQVRQSAYPKFAQDLQEMRLGRMPADLTQTVQQLPAGTMVESAVNLLPTNKEVHAANEKELARLAGDPLTLIPETGITSLRCETTATLLLRTRASFDETEFAKHVRALLQATLDLPRASLLTLYRMYEDGHAMRVVLPAGESVAWREAMRERFLEVAGLINDLQLGATVTEIVPNGDGLHTPECEDYLHRLMAKHPVAQPLTFKKGCRVLLRANLSSHLVNGSIGTVVDFVECRRESFPDYLRSDSVDECIDRYRVFCMTECGMPVAMVPVVQFYTGETVAVPPWDFAVGGSANTHYYSLSCVALPLSLAYAFTVHKVQGLTLIGRVHLELSRMWPCEHLLYVAMSRVRNPEQLSMSSFSPSMIVANAECVRFDAQLHTAHEMDSATLARYPVSAWRRCNDTIYHLRRRGCSLRRLLQDVTRGTTLHYDHHHHHHRPSDPPREDGGSARSGRNSSSSSSSSNTYTHRDMTEEDYALLHRGRGNRGDTTRPSSPARSASHSDAALARIGGAGGDEEDEEGAFADAFATGAQQENYLRRTANSVVYHTTSHHHPRSTSAVHPSYESSHGRNSSGSGSTSSSSGGRDSDSYYGGYRASMMYMTGPGDHLASIENSVLVARRMRKLVRHAERVTKIAEARRRSSRAVSHADALIVAGTPLGMDNGSMHSARRRSSSSSGSGSGGEDGGSLGAAGLGADVAARVPVEYSAVEKGQLVEEHLI